ncbi:MAG: hypothetical protein R6W73_00445 [Candidatus Saliniplasma sp.]
MSRDRPSEKVFLYLVISVILPISLILVNHLYRPDNIFLSILLVVWMGFSLLVLQPYSVEGYETVEP